MKIEQITGLRGVVAFLIAYVLHWVYLFQAAPTFPNYIMEQFFSLSMTFMIHLPNVFFVLSGYLIHQSYNARISKGEVRFVKYLLPKIKKIYPLVIATTLITWFMQRIGLHYWGFYPLHADGGEVRNSILSLFLSVLGMQSGYISDNDYCSVNGPAWFVPILFLCYVLYYVITKIIKNKTLQNVFYIAAMVLGIYIMCFSPCLPLLYNVNGRGYYSFFAGVMIKECINAIENKCTSENVAKGLNILSYVVCLIGLVGSFFIYYFLNIDINDKVLILAFFGWPSLVYLVIHGHVLRRIFSLSCFVWLGKIAMPIFLCNFPTQLLIRMCDIKFGWDLNYTNPLLWILHIVISLVIAVVAHYIFEAPLKRKTDRG